MVKRLVGVKVERLKKTCAVLAMSHEDGETTFMCVNVERPKSSERPKKSSLDGLTSNDEAIFNAQFSAQSNDGQIFIGVGKLNGWPVKVLR